MSNADIGVIGLAVMGQNLAMNMADHGFRVAVHNRTTSVTDALLSGPGAGLDLVGAETLVDLVAALRRPRRIMLMVKAGAVVDAVLDELVPLLEAGDVVIDGGNSHHPDTERRVTALAGQGLHFVGAGVSGGEEGARHGPSIMPGGDAAAWPLVQDVLQSIAADAPDGTPCCDWIGPGGAGHFVKMVHNGIEYGDMQVIAEAYDLMSAMGMTNTEMSAAFREWGDGVLDSFLIDITADILAYVDPATGEATVDVVLDAAGQKGTGKWTAIESLEAGEPLTLVAEAVYARIVSSFHDRRQRAAVLGGPDRRLEAASISLDDLRDALYASKLVSYAQGFMLLRDVGEARGWDLDLGRIAGLWRAGCIIRAAFLDDITTAFVTDPDLENLLLDSRFRRDVEACQQGWRRVVSSGVAAGIPLPAYSSALAFYDGIRSERLPANLIQAQRDYFGAHTYERVDRPRGETFHTDWTGHGGDVTSGAYQV